MFTAFRDGIEGATSELRDAFMPPTEAGDEYLVMPTPDDRWFVPDQGWPASPNPNSCPVPEGSKYKGSEWKAPAALCPNAAEEPYLFSERKQQAKIGDLHVEVLEADKLPNSILQFGAVDPYAVVAFEGNAGRTSAVRHISDIFTSKIKVEIGRRQQNLGR